MEKLQTLEEIRRRHYSKMVPEFYENYKVPKITKIKSKRYCMYYVISHVKFWLKYKQFTQDHIIQNKNNKNWGYNYRSYSRVSH